MQINLSATEAMIFSRVSARAAAFDHLHVAVDFIRAINVNPQTIHFVEIENGNAEAFQLFRGSIRAGNRTLDLPLHRAQRIDKVCRG